MSKYSAEVYILGAGDSELAEISRKNILALTIEEMKAVRAYFEKAGRNPTDCEIETIAQTWSEHCCHKVFRSEIEYTEKIEGEGTKESIVLLKEIKKATENINSGLCVSVFKDNAGIIRFNEKYGIAFKVETHNHPSALEPYGGAGTGIGGVIRDILGAGKGAMPILNTDVFCLGMPDTPYEKLPEGVLHPHRIFRGVVSGVRDYGNRMGIPTGAGAIVFDRGYQNNCLVFCGTVGVIPLAQVEKRVVEDDCIVIIGGRTGRDGIHGATFSSASLDADISNSVVQIGNPIVEKKMMDVLLVARDEGLYNSVTDCGAGGLSSAVGEMGRDMGAVVNLEMVPLKCSDLLPWEVWISESQERMVLSVPERNLTRLLELFSGEDVEATVIGRFIKTGRLKLYYRDESVCDIEMDFLHNGLPLKKMRAYFFSKGKPVKGKTSSMKTYDWKERLLRVLGNPNVASKELVVRQYDHEVQAHTVLKPFTGIEGKGPSDAAVIKPFYDDYRGIAVGCGMNPFYGKSDPYLMAGCCIEEALRNLVAAGTDPEQVVILDNFCWGDLNEDGQLGMLVRCVKGCRDFALEYKLPFISGKDSLNNVFTDAKTGVKTSIPDTLLISAVGIVPDIRKTVSSDLKKRGNVLYLCGNTRREMGGSQYHQIFGTSGGSIPMPVPSKALPLMKKIHLCIKGGIIESCHDCSDGGFAVALMEMALGGGMGADVFLDRMGCPDCSVENLLFSESQGRFIIEVDVSRRDIFEKIMKGMEIAEVGRVLETNRVECSYRGKKIFSLDIEEAERVWRSGLQW
jgi:phosphoribosylformylglycinamidine synthase subunit PurSL